MNRAERIFNPFRDVLVPVVEGADVENALRLAGQLGGRVHLLGLAVLPQDVPLSAGASAARRLRRRIEGLAAVIPPGARKSVRVAYNPWEDLRQYLNEDPPDLLVMGWPGYGEVMGISAAQALVEANCNVALVRGRPPAGAPGQRVLLPLRGGPFAELALRVGMALPHSQLMVMNIVRPEASEETEVSFRGLERILPSMPEIAYKRVVAQDVTGAILEAAAETDLLVLGASGAAPDGTPRLGAVAFHLLEEAPCPVVVVKTRRPLPTKFTGPEGERAGRGAISVLVDKWFAENTYHAAEFDALDHLVELKRAQGVTISLALPALNEEETVGNVIQTVQETLVKRHPLVDEIVLIDSNSSDRTREIAAGLGVPVYIHQKLMPEHGARPGKGEALWKSLLVTHGDIVVWIDTDIVNPHPRFVYGVIGPMLVNPRIQFVKGFYQRPLKSGELNQSSGGGRVTELVARPLLNLFYPELSGVIQPLSGEYGGRRAALEQLSFFSGYGVETGLLIDAFEKFGLSAIAQVDLLVRIHHNQPLEALSKMSFGIIQTVLRKLERRFQIPILEEVNKSMKLIHYEGGDYLLQVQELAEGERPPMAETPEYRHVHPARTEG